MDGPLGSVIIGEIRSFVPIKPGSVENTAFGSVSRFVVWVTQLALVNTPLPDAAQPAGNVGAVTRSKFSEKKTVCLPSVIGKLTTPRFKDLSCNCNRAVIVLPH